MSWLVRVQSSGFGVQKYRWLAVCGLCFLASACGFEPMYGAKNSAPSAAKPLAGVQVETAAQERFQRQQLQIQLEDKLNPSGAAVTQPAFRLFADVVVTTAGLGVSRDGTVTRYNVVLTSKYQLYRSGETKPVASGTLRHVSSYNNLPNQYYSAYVSEQDAIRRGIAELAELYHQRLSSILASQ
jgi:hypothetical protein